jgi:hypothetical protein
MHQHKFYVNCLIKNVITTFIELAHHYPIERLDDKQHPLFLDPRPK